MATRWGGFLDDIELFDPAFFELTNRFYVVGGGQWERLLMCLLGFVAARVIVTWRSRSVVGDPSSGSREASHAP
jgi:hypothetical protein